MSASIALPQGTVGSIRRPSVGRAARLPGRWERSLEKRECFTLETTGAVTVSCLDGLLWVTLASDCFDYVLAPGQALRVPGGNRAVVQALSDSRFGVAPV